MGRVLQSADPKVNYKATTDYVGELKKLYPAGIDVYSDAFGGAISDAVLRLINVKARIFIAGQISQYNLEKPEPGPRWFDHLLAMRTKAQGFLVSDYAKRASEGSRGMEQWLKQEKLKYREDVAQGLENAPQAFIEMLHGRNVGKQLLQVSEWAA